MKKSRSKTFGLIVIYLLIFLCGFFVGFLILRADNERIQKEAIAERIGVNPSWDTIRNYYYCSILRYGETKENVKKSIQNIGYYRSFENTPGMLGIYFSDQITSSQLGNLLIVFDENGNLLYKKRLLGWDSATIDDCDK